MPASPLPRLAVDTHAHVFERGLPLAAGHRYVPQADAPLPAYLAHLDAHGLSHGVLVQPSFLGTDNRYLLRALGQSPARLRGVAVVDPGFDAAALAALRDAGVVGMRLNLIGQADPPLGQAPWQGLLERAAALDWHVEIHAEARRLETLVPAVVHAGCRVVVDHFGRPEAPSDLRDVARLAAGGQVWVKLSAPYRNWADPAGPARDATRILMDAYGPARLMWGSDWPHTQYEHAADYGLSRRWLDQWLDDEAVRRTVLADTPLALFQFQRNTGDCA